MRMLFAMSVSIIGSIGSILCGLYFGLYLGIIQLVGVYNTVQAGAELVAGDVAVGILRILVTGVVIWMGCFISCFMGAMIAATEGY